MKRMITFIGAAFIVFNVAAQKIDFDMQGKSGSDRHSEPGWSEWPVASKATDADTIPRLKDDGTVNYPKRTLLPEGVQIIACVPASSTEGAANGIVGVWAKANVESNTLSKVAGDAISPTYFNEEHDRFDPVEFATLRFILKGISAGKHTLLAYHNRINKGQPPMVKVQVNGVDACAPVQQTAYDGSTNYQSLDDVASTFISFEAVDGQDVIIDYIAVAADGVEYTDHTVYVNGMVFDAADPNMKVTNMRPLNGNLHVDAPDKSVTLTWTGSASAASHRVMFGTSEDNMQEVQNTTSESYMATGLTNLNTYYWRIDEIPASGDPVVGETYSFRINQLAFPGAEGFGRYAYGGRGGQAVHVNSLEDDGTEGTLRWALETVTGPRTVVFDISGIITITKPLVVNESYVTIAGQTAPGDGILIRGHYFMPGNESITRFIRHRMGSVINMDKGTGYSGMTIQGRNNVIIDHTSVGWATAETFKAAGNFTEAITVQNTIIAEALTNGMPGEENFGFGFEAGGESGTFHHNLMANNYYANPIISGGQDANMVWIGEEEYYNNVAYNWGEGSASGAASKVNFAGNYYKAGPATSPDVSSLMNIKVPTNGSGTMDYYVAGNLLDKNGVLTDNPYTVSRNDTENAEGNILEGYSPNISETKVVDNGAVYETAKTAYARVLSEVGASLKRDATDKRIVSEVSNGTTSMGENGMIENIEESDYDLYENMTRADDFDVNRNGIADWYEKATGKTDANADPDGDGYTNLEDYLNYMCTPNMAVNAGATASFDLSEYFTGVKGATYTVVGKGSVDGNMLNITPSATDTGILQCKVTATKDDVSVTREFNVYVNGTQAAIQPVLAVALVESYELYNAAGQMVGCGQGNGVAVHQLNLRTVASGVYILKIRDTEGRARSFSLLKK